MHDPLSPSQLWANNFKNVWRAQVLFYTGIQPPSFKDIRGGTSMNTQNPQRPRFYFSFKSRPTRLKMIRCNLKPVLLEKQKDLRKRKITSEIPSIK